MSIASFPAGNAFAFPIALSYLSGATSTPVPNLADALDVVVVLGVDLTAPEYTADLASGKVTIDSPDVGSITVSVLSTDSIDMTQDERHLCAVQVKWAGDETNNVEWYVGPVFTLRANFIAPFSA